MSEETTEDGFLNGQVRVVQPAIGYRAGLDAVLLAASLSANAGERLAEAGCGAGAALLCAAHRLTGAHLTGFERDGAAADLARRGVILNGFAGRVDVALLDIASRPPELENRFDQAFCNPPFFEPGKARPPAPGKQSAYMLDQPLKAWILFLTHIVRPGGRVTLIHRAAALADLLELLNPRLGEIGVLPVRPAPGHAAHRVLIAGRKALKKGPVTLYEGLTLHSEAGGPPTGRAASVLAGGELNWI